MSRLTTSGALADLAGHGADDSLALPPAVSSAAPAAECSDRNDLAEQKASRKHADEDAEEDEAGDPAEHVPLNDDECVVNGSDSAGASPADGTATRAGDERPANEVGCRTAGIVHRWDVVLPDSAVPLEH